jgi:hypothetical protein
MVTRLLVLVAAIFSLNLYAQNVESLTAEGTARIEAGEDQARVLATKDAYKDGVKKALTVMYGEPAVRANELKLTPLYNDAKTYILGSQQLQEKLDSSLQTLSIKLNVNVDKGALQDYLSSKGISLTSEKNMMILPLIVERSGDNSGEFWWKDSSKDTAQKKSFSDIEKALSIYFAQSSYSLIDPYQNALSSQVPQSYRYMELKVPELIELGKTFNVGLIANGYTQTNCKKDDNSCSTVVSLQMISTDTGKIIAAKRAVETGSAGDVDEAKTISRAKACQAAAGSILSQMTKKWQKRSASSYRVVFKGLNDYASYAKLRACLMSGGVGGLSNVIERYMTKGNMVFEAEKRGAADTGQTIIAKCYPSGGASVLDQSQNFVEIKTQ